MAGGHCSPDAPSYAKLVMDQQRARRSSSQAGHDDLEGALGASASLSTAHASLRRLSDVLRHQSSLNSHSRNAISISHLHQPIKLLPDFLMFGTLALLVTGTDTLLNTLTSLIPRAKS
jgi:hypothetical protein